MPSNPTDGFIEVILAHPEDFLKVRETLTRIGLTVRGQENVLHQICHILHKRGRYFIVHYKEMFILDGHADDLDTEDIGRRNLIAALLVEWGLISFAVDDRLEQKAPIQSIKIVPFREKEKWSLVPRYIIGRK